MSAVEVEYGTAATEEAVRAQLELLLRDEVFRSSKRSVAFLRYVVEQTLRGQAEQIKERSIGIEVFGRDPDYDTNADHIVRTAAVELRKRLATYYVDEKHRLQLHISLVPGSYVPRFTAPPESDSAEREGTGEHAPIGEDARAAALEPEQQSANRRSPALMLAGALGAVVLAALLGYGWARRPPVGAQFWKPVLETPGAVLVAVGDAPHGPPTLPASPGTTTQAMPVPGADPNATVPFADAVTVARVVGALESQQKKVVIRRESDSSFSDLRQGAVVLIGAFNNEWSLRLTHPLRYSLALDPDRNLIYIRDARNPSARTWSWGTNQPRDLVRGINSPKLEDYALISRIVSSDTGHPVVVIGGLYIYGTEATGELLSDQELMDKVLRDAPRPGPRGVLQIVIGTTVTDGVPGPPRILAVSTE